MCIIGVCSVRGDTVPCNYNVEFQLHHALGGVVCENDGVCHFQGIMFTHSVWRCYAKKKDNFLAVF